MMFCGVWRAPRRCKKEKKESAMHYTSQPLELSRPRDRGTPLHL